MYDEMPVLCRACGGTAQVLGVELRCPYCGATEQLPPDRAALVADLQRRVVISASAATQFSGSMRSLAGIFERPSVVGGVTGFMLILGAVLAVVMVIGSAPTWLAAPSELRAGLMISALATPVWVLSVPVSFICATLVGRWRYRMVVRPYLLARAPLMEGGPARCRACGANLPAEKTPVLRCRFCATESVVGPELHGKRAAFLERERLDCLAKARGLVTSARTISSWVGVTMGVTLALGFFATGAVIWLAEQMSP